MEIAIPRACQPDEQRVALTPAGVQALIRAGHTVYFEHEAGTGAGFADVDYSAVGAQVLYSPAEVYARGDLLLTVDGVPEPAIAWLRPRQLLCGFLRLSVMQRRILAALAQVQISTLSYELIRDENGVLPVLLPMSEITGRLLPQLARAPARDAQRRARHTAGAVARRAFGRGGHSWRWNGRRQRSLRAERLGRAYNGARP